MRQNGNVWCERLSALLKFILMFALQELDSLRANDDRRRQDIVRAAVCSMSLRTCIDRDIQVSSFESRLNKVVAVQDDLWEVRC